MSRSWEVYPSCDTVMRLLRSGENNYRPRRQESYLRLFLEVSTSNNGNFNASITIDKVHDYSGDNLVLQLVITESHIDESW
ncbi:MAG: hypothetical protein HQ543_09750 [Bacteroidetes bacterium]|nr:hypothetical protein [Bacteroidota bacterium]